MNIIGLMVPKIISLLVILLPNYNVKQKMILIGIWVLKFVISYEAAKQNHGWKFKNVVIRYLYFIPDVIFVVTAARMNAWIPTILGVMTVLLDTALLIETIVQTIVRKKQRRKRNASADYQK